MPDYPTVKNPLLPASPPSSRRLGAGPTSTSLAIKGKGLSSASFRNFFSRSFYQLSTAGTQIRLGAPTHKRIGPSSSFTETKRSLTGLSKKYSHTVAKGASSDPVVHYNGPCDTLDQLPGEKLAWIKREPVSAEGLRHPLLDCSGSIVLRKPVTRSQTFPLVQQPISVAAPKAAFYLRVIQIVSQNATKPCYLRCSVQVDNCICTGGPVAAEKCGKHNIQADVDETFIFDIDQPTSATLKVFTQPKPSIFSTRTHLQGETCLGKEEFRLYVQPCDKVLRRITLGSTPACQILVIYGTYMSNGAQVLLDNKCIYAGFITVYIRGRATPKWERFWAALHGTRLLLYDFEFRDTRPPLYEIPLDYFVHVSHPPTDDDERQVDVGSLGLALQFTERALNRHDLRYLEETTLFECRMYVLPDSMSTSRDWEQAFAYIANLLNHYRDMESGSMSSLSYTTASSLGLDGSGFYSSFDESISESEDAFESSTVPSKFMW
ncbi:hypothetical protein BDB00DRAFT_799690 [Zychaea mexicana]|uniref:uncharacterized protein n=1 Tax=Zychaea mexicana TaxID=64656 RepID=UPI0022FF3E55|nr:uncharacterized protein BDB00DRAFT_799690 [Zychaea mexicana]KAI9498283.1 hypothetical protein BDB00DRAFT_799690 [Zychaea mexicana]